MSTTGKTCNLQTAEVPRGNLMRRLHKVLPDLDWSKLLALAMNPIRSAVLEDSIVGGL